MRDLLSEKCTKPGLRHKILCRSPFVQFSQLQKPKFVKVLLYTNEKDKITTKGKKNATKTMQRAANLFIAFFVHL